MVIGKLNITSNLVAVLGVFGLLVILNSGTLAAGKGADEFIKSVGQQAIDSLTGKHLTDEQRQAGFREILTSKFEVPLIARFTLGRAWRKASADQRKEYIALFQDYIVLAYAALFRDYNGETFTVGTAKAINKTDVAVKSELSLKDGQKIVVFWRVRDKGEYKIIDVVVEGVSMVITQRDEFAAIIDRNGGTVDGLLAALRKKTKK
jgi:phospholipid transport system substrate-binding protein